MVQESTTLYISVTIMDINAQGGMNYELPPPMALHTGVRVDPAERRGARVEIGARLEAGAGAKHPDLLMPARCRDSLILVFNEWQTYPGCLLCCVHS